MNHRLEDNVVRPLKIKVPDGVSLKDPALVRMDGTYHLVCSWFYDENFCKLAAWRSSDLELWEGPLWTSGDGAAGFCSPDIFKENDGWIMTYQSWDGLHPRQSGNQLFYSTSIDLESWSEPIPLAQNLTAGKRAIDPALAFHRDRWYLIYKEAQTPCLATSQNLNGPWEPLSRPVPFWIENAQFLKVEGHWHLYGTLTGHVQGISRMASDGNEPADWSNWEAFQMIQVPRISGFNREIPANAGCLWDDRAYSGNWLRAFCSADTAPRNNLGYTLGLQAGPNLNVFFDDYSV